MRAALMSTMVTLMCGHLCAIIEHAGGRAGGLGQLCARPECLMLRTRPSRASDCPVTRSPTRGHLSRHRQSRPSCVRPSITSPGLAEHVPRARDGNVRGRRHLSAARSSLGRPKGRRATRRRTLDTPISRVRRPSHLIWSRSRAGPPTAPQVARRAMAALVQLPSSVLPTAQETESFATHSALRHNLRARRAHQQRGQL